ncbi:hypothetical protein HPB48_006088 [Haemaphysalis longicornis]|uniref:Uncharacterized protein n=1 Tax=Haemaphysalis longicornis TaxID=44386 RepID=A0A9J6GU36_HAELO|nr:hypothetical protein HPB48_006088 [Haemaphysalis longicornis]
MDPKDHVHDDPTAESTVKVTVGSSGRKTIAAKVESKPTTPSPPEISKLPTPRFPKPRPPRRQTHEMIFAGQPALTAPSSDSVSREPAGASCYTPPPAAVPEERPDVSDEVTSTTRPCKYNVEDTVPVAAGVNQGTANASTIHKTKKQRKSTQPRFKTNSQQSFVNSTRHRTRPAKPIARPPRAGLRAQAELFQSRDLSRRYPNTGATAGSENAEGTRMDNRPKVNHVHAISQAKKDQPRPEQGPRSEIRASRLREASAGKGTVPAIAQASDSMAKLVTVFEGATCDGAHAPADVQV